MRYWLKFNIVGVLGFAIQSGALFLLTHGARPIGYLAATALAVELAVLNNFIWHQRWTWNDRPSANSKDTWRRLAKFNLTTGLVSITGNVILMSILVGRIGLPIAGANVVTVAGCSVVSFFLADRLAFERNANC